MDNKYELEKHIKDAIEKFLYAYPSLLEYVEDNFDEIEEMRESGLQSKSKDIIGNEGHGGNAEHRPEHEKLTALESKAIKTQKQVEKIKRRLESLKKQDIEEYQTDMYYNIIELYYFKKVTFEKIGYKINISTTSTRYHHDRLLYKLAIKLYGIEIIKGSVN